MNKQESYWRKKLTQKQYKILREKETEQPFTGKFLSNEEKGVYICAGCGNKLFSSEAKYNSGTGWPSFYDLISQGAVTLNEDSSFGMRRVEVVCSKCGGHLGHVFSDGPKPMGKRYCINSCALEFKKRADS